MRRLLLAALLAVPMPGAAVIAQSAPPRLSLPIACEPGKTCFVQNYVDDDPGPAAKDYTCSGRTYNGHDGVDIRIPDLKAMRTGVPVLAAAPGKVLRLRNDMEDVDPRTRPPLPRDRYCGNGVIIDDGDGWQTQYCHMRQGSVVVKPGQILKTGDKIGLVGQSGQADFPHVHLGVSQDGKSVDPFAYGAPPESCKGGKSLWTPAVANKLAFRQTEMINAGFAAASIDNAAVDAGDVAPPTRDSPWLVAYFRVIGLKAGDVEQITLSQPDGTVIVQSAPTTLQSDKAVQFRIIGKRTPPAGWPAGTYHAVYAIQRGGKPALERRLDIRL